MRPSHLEYLRQSWALRETGQNSRLAAKKVAGNGEKPDHSGDSSVSEAQFGPAYRVSLSSFSNPIGHLGGKGAHPSPASPEIIHWSEVLQGWV
jgi:hypothetical protein